MNTGEVTAPFKTIAFLGLGLIGGSLARRVKAVLPGTTILAFDISGNSLAQATRDGVVDQVLAGLEDPQLMSADLVILATHLEHNKALLKQLNTIDRPHPWTVMDMGSTKQSMCTLGDEMQNISFLGGHPLAGREVSGFESSRADLFLGKRFLLTPTAKTDPTLISHMASWLTQIGMIPVQLSPQKHDTLMSVVSHFPQFYAYALANLLARHDAEDLLHYLGGGIDDQMRLMASPPVMWEMIFTDNREAMRSVLDEFITVLTDMRKSLDDETLRPWFDTSQDVYARYQKLKTEQTLT